MRIFKHSAAFCCSQESPVDPYGFLCLFTCSLHSLQEALYSIAAIIGKPLHVNHARASSNSSFTARILSWWSMKSCGFIAAYMD